MKNDYVNYADDDYILFIAQEVNFQSRSILIPIKYFLLVREKEYNILESNTKTVKFSKNDDIITLDNILIQKYKYVDNLGHQEIYPYTNFCNILTEYAYGMEEENCYIDLNDKIWYDKSFCNICKGFDHVQNYLECIKMTHYKNKKINIIKSFLYITI